MIDLRPEIAVVGMGYVGIPLATLLARAGHAVIGIDLSEERAAKLSRGEYPLRGEEPGLPEMLDEQVKAGRLGTTTDFAACAGARAVFICVDTPIDENRTPDFGHLLKAVESVGRCISPGTLVVVESTVSPGTMRDKVLPALERTSGLKAGEGFFLAHCPERVMAGRLISNLTKLDRVIGGLDKRSAELAVEWYSRIVEGRLLVTDMTSTEVAKTAENAYRDVQIAFANEVGMICEQLGVDAFKVRELVNSCPGRQMLLPGAGVGGHCLPKDSWLLVHGGRDARPRLIPTAREVNDSMPQHVATLVLGALEEADLGGGREACVGVFGLSYLEDTGDVRNAPARALVDELREHRLRLVGHDPYVDAFEGLELVDELEEALGMCDCAVFVTAHAEYRQLDLKRLSELMRTRVIVDGRNLFDKESVSDLGFVYRAVGKG